MTKRERLDQIREELKRIEVPQNLDGQWEAIPRKHGVLVTSHDGYKCFELSWQAIRKLNQYVDWLEQPY